MKRPHPKRPSAAMGVALLALFFALGGSVYAAATINGKTIKKNSEPGNRIKKGTLTAKQVKSAKNANTVDGRSATCPAGTKFFVGGCWETAASATGMTAPGAAQACAAKGGSLPRTFDLVAFSKQPGITLDMGDEWTSDIVSVTAINNYNVVIVAPNGDVNLDNQTDTKKFRCVLPLVH